MKKSHKHITFEVLPETNSRKKSPKSSTPLRLQEQVYANKGSNDISFGNSNLSLMGQNRSKEKIARNLFDSSPKKGKNSKIGEGNMKSKYEQNSQEKESNELYNSSVKNGALFKKSIQKVKKALLSGVRSNQEMTIRKLKTIGKYGQSRQKNKQRGEIVNPQMIKRESPVEFNPNDGYPFLSYKALEQARLAESKQSSNIKQFGLTKQPIEIGAYFHFQEELKRKVSQLQKQNNKMNRAIIPSSKSPVLSSNIKGKKRDVKNVSPCKNLSPSWLDSINYVQIDAICEIFEMCEKSKEEDTLAGAQFKHLLQEFERVYFINLIQESQADGSRGRLKILESEFRQLLRKFQQNFKVGYEKKQKCTIFDCLYYLTEAGRLDRVCALFLGIKNMLHL